MTLLSILDKKNLSILPTICLCIAILVGQDINPLINDSLHAGFL